MHDNVNAPRKKCFEENKVIQWAEIISYDQIYVVHQQDRLLSCQLRPTFPPAWKE